MNSDQLLLNGDRLVAASKLGSMVSKSDSPIHGDVAVPYDEGSSKQHMKQSGLVSVVIDDYFELPDEEQVLGRKAECRFCQEEDFIRKMEAPCACKGTIQYAHRKCVQKWCSAKRSITCEICSQRYKPGYRAPPPPLDLSDSIAPGPRILVFTQAILQQQALLEPEPVEQPQTDEVLTQTKRCCGTFILLQTLLFCYNLMMMTVLVIVKDVVAGSHPREKLDTSGIFHLAMAFLLPSYVMAFLLYFCPWERLQPEETTPGNTERPEVAIEVDSGVQNETADHQQRQDKAIEPEVVSETEVHPEGSSIRNFVTRESSQGNHLYQCQGQNPVEATSENTETPAEVVIAIEFENQNAAADHRQLDDDEIEARPLLSKLRNSLARLRPQGNN